MLDFSKLNIAVYGDIMLDEYHIGTSDRLSPECPVPIVLWNETTHTLGGAGNVANNIVALGANAELHGIIGMDRFGGRVFELLDNIKVPFAGLYEKDKPTIVKTRVVSNNNHQIVRIDREDKFTMDITETPFPNNSNGIIISDYNKGTIKGNIAHVISQARELGILTFLDPKDTAYFGVTVLKLNNKQAFSLTQRKDPEQAARILKERYIPEYVVVTCGGDGMIALDKEDKTISLRALKQDVFDVSGAGDTVIATLALCMCSGLSLEKSLTIANHAAGVVVSKHGTAVCNINELKGALL